MVDVTRIAQDLITQMWTESDKLKERAEGVRLLYEALCAEQAKEDVDVGRAESTEPELRTKEEAGNG